MAKKKSSENSKNPESAKKTNGRGGKREGAGPKPVADRSQVKRPRSLYVNDSEWREINAAAESSGQTASDILRVSGLRTARRINKSHGRKITDGGTATTSD